MNDKFETTLRTSGYSLTKPRRAVFAALQNTEPLTMAELIARTSNIDRASVYRTVELFQDLGIVERVQHGWKYRLELSDAFQSHHHHISCLRCGKSIDIQADARLEARLHELADRSGFQLVRHQLELQGYCRRCRKALLSPQTT